MKFVVGKAEEIPQGSRKIVRVAGRSIGVFNVGGEYYAIRNRCPHQGAPLCEGKLWGSVRSNMPGEYDYDGSKEILACIQHGWEFSVKTGQSWCDPKRLRVRAYSVDVQNPEAVSPDLPTATPDLVKNRLIVTANEVRDQATNPATRVELTGAPEPEPAEDPEAPAPGMVKGPYAVETFPVEVEGGYLYLVVDVVDVGANTRSSDSGLGMPVS